MSSSSQKCKSNEQCTVPGYCCHHTSFTCTRTLSCIHNHQLHSCTIDSQCPTGCCNYVTKICTNDNLKCNYDGSVPNTCETNSNCPVQGQCCNQITHLCGQANCLTADGKRGYGMQCDRDYQCATSCCDRDVNFCVFNKDLCDSNSSGGGDGISSLGFGLVAGGILIILILFCVIFFTVCKKKQQNWRSGHSNTIPDEYIQRDSEDSDDRYGGG